MMPKSMIFHSWRLREAVNFMRVQREWGRSFLIVLLLVESCSVGGFVYRSVSFAAGAGCSNCYGFCWNLLVSDLVRECSFLIMHKVDVIVLMGLLCHVLSFDELMEGTFDGRKLLIGTLLQDFAALTQDYDVVGVLDGAHSV
jgi:hypothetical protein